MSENRAFTPIEKAVTDLVTEFSKVDGAAKQVDKLEEFIEHVLTVRELIKTADDTRFMKSTRLELLNEATILVNLTIKDLGERKILLSLERLRVECAEAFIKVTEEKLALPLGVDPTKL